MKKLHIFLVTLLFSILIVSCLEPIENREDMNMNPVKITGSDYSVTQNQSYDNKIYLESKIQGALPFWDYGLGTSKKDKDTLIIPFAGDYWIKFIAYTKEGPGIDSVKITVSQNDPVFFADPGWAKISNMVAGKTWVVDNLPGGWAWGCAGMDSPYPVWWGMSKAESIAEPTPETEDKVYFDLNQGFHIKIIHKDGTVQKGFWNWKPGSTSVSPASIGTLTLAGGVLMPLSARAGVGSEYTVMKLTDDELCLWSGWACFVFKREGYIYP